MREKVVRPRMSRLSMAFSPAGIGWDDSRLSLALEVSHVPYLDKAQRRPSIDKPESTNLAPFFPRPRISLGLGAWRVEASWIPPMRVFDVEANLGSLAIRGPSATIGAFRLSPRAYACLTLDEEAQGRVLDAANSRRELRRIMEYSAGRLGTHSNLTSVVVAFTPRDPKRVVLEHAFRREFMLTPLTEAHAVSHTVKDLLMERYPEIADAIIHIEPPPR